MTNLDGATAPAARTKHLWLAFLVALPLIAVPVFAVRHLPVTDLPQHLAQARLLLEKLAGGGAEYSVQWFTPYGLVYGLLAIVLAIVGPAYAPGVSLVALAAIWLGAVALLVRQRRRPAAGIVLASVFFFSHVITWGFLPFAFGWCLFCLWLVYSLVPVERTTPLLHGAITAAILAATYLSHALWFAAALLWLPIGWRLTRGPRWLLFARSAGALPIAVLAAWWYPQFAVGAFAKPAAWHTLPFERIGSLWLVDAAFGSLRGPTESLIFVLLVVWALVALWQNRTEARWGVDLALACAGAMLLVAALILPEFFRNTLRFAQRWLPFALTLLVLALPRLRLRGGMPSLAALLIAATLSTSTFAAWRWFEDEELSGLDEALSALPEKPRVLGLEFIQQSRAVAGRPFLQQFAYAQVLHGGELGFSFASFPLSLVVYREKPRLWTPGLEWFPERVKPADFAFFDYVLLSGGPAVHDEAVARLGLTPVTDGGLWRLYRVPAAPAAQETAGDER